MSNVINLIGEVVLYVLALVCWTIKKIVWFGVYYLMGKAMNHFIGVQLTTGLNILLGTDRFTQDTFPLVFASVYWILSIIYEVFKSDDDKDDNIIRYLRSTIKELEHK